MSADDRGLKREAGESLQHWFTRRVWQAVGRAPEATTEAVRVPDSLSAPALLREDDEDEDQGHLLLDIAIDSRVIARLGWEPGGMDIIAYDLGDAFLYIVEWTDEGDEEVAWVVPKAHADELIRSIERDNVRWMVEQDRLHSRAGGFLRIDIAGLKYGVITLGLPYAFGRGQHFGARLAQTFGGYVHEEMEKLHTPPPPPPP